MKSPIKLENDIRKFSKVEKVILAVVLALVVLVVISWAVDGFAFKETRSGSNLSQITGYGVSMTANVNPSEDEYDRE